MFGLNPLQTLFVVTAFLFQIVLIIHFALRKWRFHFAIRHGWIVYALSLPSAAVSILLLEGQVAWSLWLGGFLYLVWAVYGFTIEYGKKIAWRDPIRWSIFGPYVLLYLATVMFYWFPLALVYKPLWYAYAVLFIVSTWLNVTSHKAPISTEDQTQ
ncbi:MAG TPA: hypothetical protein VMC62_05390 [Longilinea sp.]|nr:hypothetical protein [Longilinea sp.]